MMSRRSILEGAAAALVTGAAGVPGAGAIAPGRDFDFLHGAWQVTHRKLRRRLAGSKDWFSFPGTLEVRPILDGLGNFDDNRLADPGGAYQAHSLRVFRPDSGLWSIWWLDSRFPGLDGPVVGRFADGKGTFFADDRLEGRPIKVRTTYESLSARTAKWTQAFSADGGENWEVNWIMEFERRRA